MKKQIIFLSIMILGIQVANAQTQERRVASPEQFFEAVDENNDGQLSFEEFQNFKPASQRADKSGKTDEERFAKLDADANGFVTQEELKAAKKGKKDKMKHRGHEGASKIKKADTNGDQKISFQEFSTIDFSDKPNVNVQEMFNKMDADGNGFIEKGEVRQKAKDKKKHKGHMKFDQKLKAADVNADEKISYDEFTAVDFGSKRDIDTEALFNKLDANGDGFIEKGEMHRKSKGKMKLKGSTISEN